MVTLLSYPLAYPLVMTVTRICSRVTCRSTTSRVTRPAYDFTVEDYIATLDRHGVRYGVIAAASPWSDYNDYTIDSVRSNPRLRGTVIVKPSVERYILELMKKDGIVGVRLPFIGLPKSSGPDVVRIPAAAEAHRRPRLVRSSSHRWRAPGRSVARCYWPQA